ASGTIVETLDNTNSTPQTVTYTFTASANGCPVQVTSVDVVVDPTPTFTNLPATATICSGDQLNFTPTSDVAGTVFTWTSGTPTNITGNTDGVGAITDILTNTGNDIEVITYTITATGPGPESCANPVTQDYVVTVNPAVTQTITNNDPIVCEGVPVDIDYDTPTENGDITLTATYPSGVTGSVDYTGQSIGASGTIVETLDNTNSTPQTVTYTFTASANGCPVQVTSVDVRVDPTPDVSASDQTICSGETTNIVITNPNGVAGTTFSWIVQSTTNTLGATPGTGAVISQQLASADGDNAGTVVYEITPSAAGCDGTPILVTVTINATPVAEVAEPLQSRCDGEMTNVVLINPNIPGTLYRWTVDQMGVNGASDQVMPVSGPIQQTVNLDVVNVPGTVRYTIIPVSPDNCEGSPITSIVRVLPIPSASAMDQTVCSGDEALVNITPDPNNVIGTAFSWTASPSANVIGSFDGDGSTIRQTLTTTDANVGTVVYTITPTAEGCVGATFDVTVTVNPLPTSDAGADFIVCDPVSFDVVGTVGGSAVSGTWTIMGGSGAGTLSSSSTVGNTVTATYTVDPADLDQFVTFQLETNDPDGTGPCVSAFDEVVVHVSSLPVVFFTAPAAVAENGAPLSITANQAGGLFTITPGSGLGTTFVNSSGVDEVIFDPGAATAGTINTITYSFTDPATGCMNMISRDVIVNPVTSIDFVVDNAIEDVLGQPQICAESGLVRLFGNPPVSSGDPGTEFTVPTGFDNPIEISGGQFFIQTDGLEPGTYPIQYIFVDGIVTNAITKNIIVYPTPVVEIDVDTTNCIDDVVQFNDASFLSSTPFSSSIIEWHWDFGDGGSSSLQNPTHQYMDPGTYNVTLTVTTDAPTACSSSTTVQIEIGQVPNVLFDWTNICNGDATEFIDLSDTGDGGISTIVNYTWDFGDGESIQDTTSAVINAHGGRTTGMAENPFHEYVLDGNYDVTLTVRTDNGCVASAQQSVFILPFRVVTPLPGEEYSEDFEADDGGWEVEALLDLDTNMPSDTSWLLTLPNGNTINSAASGVRAWWTGRNSGSGEGTYFPSEQSVVNGPCFDLSQLSRPKVEMDIWVDTQVGFDGAVLQYSIDGGLIWSNIGVIGEGINWYNEQGLLGNPGQQTIGQVGWSDVSGEWKNARFSLDEIPIDERNFVRLRVAFGSDENNPSGTDLNGFAFDNVFVGQRQRNVLIEHFSNSTLNISNDANAYIYGLYNDQQDEIDTVDFTILQYHIATPSPDQLNRDNPIGPSARSIFYGVSQPPSTSLDGNLGGEFGGNPFDIARVDIERRALVDPLFDIQIDTLPRNRSTLAVNLTITAKGSLDAPILVNAALVEMGLTGDSGDSVTNVLRKLIFGEGEVINMEWSDGVSRNDLTAEVNIDVPIENPDRLAIIAFVQDVVTREIYQSEFMLGPVKDAGDIVGLEEELISQAENIEVYPNPTSGILNFEANFELIDDYDWKIVDQRGVEIKKGNLDFGRDSRYTVEVKDIPEGVYFLVIGSNDTALVHKKIAIVHTR
ncbi:MAG: PKD-like domain-containing protein, partial [Bacteroidota bacterium]